MCGIAGIFSMDGEKVKVGYLKDMCEAIRHRGPDDDGFHIDGNVGISMRRLSVIDLSTGTQPVHNEDKSVWVVFNGEIYNFKERKKELEKKHTFYTQTDTEVIVHLYEEYGEDFVGLLNGMFTFALWDSRSRTLYIGRDRLGIKPLYYTETNGKLAFASEIKALLTLPFVKREIEINALDCYFSFLYTPGPLTMIKGIKKLLPGHMMILKENKKEIKKYWELSYTPLKRASIEDLAEEFRLIFRRAVKSQMMSDVPLGAFLSGGIDSSAIVALMSEYSSSPVETFSIGYGKDAAYYDESDDARLISRRYGTSHHEFILKADILESMPEMVRSLDEPLGDDSTIPNYFISKKTREFVTVALSGLGGDELCGGYQRYVGMYIAGFYRQIPKIIREQIISKLVLSIPDSSKGKRFVDRAKRFIKSGALMPGDAYHGMISSFDRENREGLLTPSVMKGIRGNPAEELFNQYFSCHENEHILNKVLFTDLKLYLVDDLLTLSDSMSMAHSLEVRVPFLDNDLVDFMASIPPEYKVNRLTKKFLLKKSLKGILPNSILYKEKKGFSVPLVIWFRERLRPFLRGYLTRERIERLGFLNWDYIDNLMTMHFERKGNYFGQIWSILVFCMWHSMCIEGADIAQGEWKELVGGKRYP